MIKNILKYFSIITILALNVCVMCMVYFVVSEAINNVFMGAGRDLWGSDAMGWQWKSVSEYLGMSVIELSVYLISCGFSLYFLKLKRYGLALLIILIPILFIFMLYLLVFYE